MSPATLCTLALIVAYILLFSLVTVGRHRAMGTHTFDLVNMDQAVWNTLRGRWLEHSTVPGISTRLANHFEPILFPISLLYLIHDGAETLLVLQTVAIALGALPVYWLARDRFDNAWAGVLFAALYLLYPSTESANDFDFHPVALAAPLLLFAIHAIHSKHRGWAVFFCILAMGCKENIPLLVAMLGVYVWILGKDRRLGLLLLGLGTVWFLVAFQIVIPHFVPSGGSRYISRYRQWGDSKGEILFTLLTDPRGVWLYLTQPFKLKYFWNLLFPFAFVPLLAPQWLLVSAPSLAINLLSGEHAQSLADTYHYPASIVPFVVTASIYGGSWLVHTLSSHLRLNKSWVLTGFMVVISTTSLFQHYYRGFTPLALAFTWPEQTEHHRIGMKIMSRIPSDASVSAQSDLGPHLSHRKKLYLFPRIDDAEYVMLDVTSNTFPIRDHKDYKKAIKNTLGAGFGVLESRDGYLLLKRGLNNHTFDPDLYSFAWRDKDFQPQHRIEATFEEKLRLLGYDLEQHRNAVVRLITYWQLEEPIEASLRIQIYATDVDGEILDREVMRWPDSVYKPRTMYWFPPEQWPIKTIVAVDSGRFNLAQVPEVHLAAGIVASAGTPDAQRLGAHIVSSPMGPPLVQGTTLVRLVGLCRKNTVLLDCSQFRNFSKPSSGERVHHSLGHQVTLVGYELSRQTVRPGDTLEFTLHWQSLTSMNKDYTVFAHLTGPEPWPIWGQTDRQPWQGRYPTSWWAPLEMIADSYQVPVGEETPPGVYLLRVGMYYWPTGERLSVSDSDNENADNLANDHIILTKIEILPHDR